MTVSRRRAGPRLSSSRLARAVVCCCCCCCCCCCVSLAEGGKEVEGPREGAAMSTGLVRAPPLSASAVGAGGSCRMERSCRHSCRRARRGRPPWTPIGAAPRARSRARCRLAGASLLTPRPTSRPPQPPNQPFPQLCSIRPCAMHQVLSQCAHGHHDVGPTGCTRRTEPCTRVLQSADALSILAIHHRAQPQGSHCEYDRPTPVVLQSIWPSSRAEPARRIIRPCIHLRLSACAQR